MKNTNEPNPRPRRFAIWALAAAAWLLSACGSSGAGTAEPATATLTPTPASASTAAATTAPPADERPFTETSDMVYMTIDGVELLMDVFTPAGDGPWPVVVSFHGLSNEGKDLRETIVVAEEAASRGMVVFTPTWIAGNPFPITSETFETWDDTVSCAVAFAQENAAGYGGDPANTVVDGFSAGAGAALLFASQEPRVAPAAGCETDALPAPVGGFVVGDVESWLYSQNFDGAFGAEPDAIQERLAALIGPSSWEHGADARFFIWVADAGVPPRPIGDITDDTGWFSQRDPDGSIQADLESLGQLADGVVDTVDAGQLLNLRLSRAGIDATLDEYPGGHTTLDKVPEIIGYLQAAVSR